MAYSICWLSQWSRRTEMSNFLNPIKYVQCRCFLSWCTRRCCLVFLIRSLISISQPCYQRQAQKRGEEKKTEKERKGEAKKRERGEKKGREKGKGRRKRRATRDRHNATDLPHIAMLFAPIFSIPEMRQKWPTIWLA